MGTKCRDVARMLRMGPNTERQYRDALIAAELLDGDPLELPEVAVLKAAILEQLPPKPVPQQTSSVQKWAEAVQEMVDDGASPTAIFDKLRLEDKEFDGSLSAIKRLCLKLKRAKGVQPEDIAIPVHTDPGQVAQVDFGYLGKLYDPEQKRFRKAWVFVMVLGFSRHMFARIVFDQKARTWLRVHVEAFAELGGVPEIIVPDNLKAAVIRAAFGVDGDTALNYSYRELARYYGFKVDPTPPVDPKKKGKVESGVKYVRRNFYKPRKAVQDADLLAEQLAQWVVKIAGQRIHGTTQQRPLEVFEQIEREALLDLPAQPYELVIWRDPEVRGDSHVIVDKAFYSVPWRLKGKKVLVRAVGSTVAIHFEDERVATHDLHGPGQWSTKDEHLPEHRRDLRHRSRPYWEKRADAMGESVGRYVREVFDSDDVLYKIRVVQYVVTFLEGVPAPRARAACERASFYASYSYGAIKKIITKELDRQPLPTVVQPQRGGLENPRFVRDVRELIELPLEASDAPQ